MIRETRERKRPDSFVIPKICFPRVRKRKQKTKVKKIEECGYQFIPVPLKFLYPYTIYPMYGNSALKEESGTLQSENTYCSNLIECRGIDLRENEGYRCINILFSAKSTQIPHWQEMVEKLRSYNTREQNEWAYLIEKYSLNYENMLRARACNQINVRGYTSEYLTKLNKESMEFKQKMLKKYPCVSYKMGLNNNHIILESIVINEKFIEEVGYTLDSFIVTTLREGMPTITSETPTGFEKYQLNHFFNPERSVQELPVTKVQINTKTGYIKQMNYQLYLLGTFEDNTFMPNYLLVITKSEPPKKALSSVEGNINKTFLERIRSQEYEAQDFLKKYYNTNKIFRYINEDKVCKIREIDVHEEDEEDDHLDLKEKMNVKDMKIAYSPHSENSETTVTTISNSTM